MPNLGGDSLLRQHGSINAHIPSIKGAGSVSFMKTQPIIPLLLLAGCCAVNAQTTNSLTNTNRVQLLAPAVSQASTLTDAPTPKQIAQANQRLHLLKADMTDEQVFSTLGLTNCWRTGMGGGPLSNHWTSYEMRDGHVLNLIHRATSETPTSTGVNRTWSLVSVSLDGVAWESKNSKSQ